MCGEFSMNLTTNGVKHGRIEMSLSNAQPREISVHNTTNDEDCLSSGCS